MLSTTGRIEATLTGAIRQRRAEMALIPPDFPQAMASFMFAVRMTESTLILFSCPKFLVVSAMVFAG